MNYETQAATFFLSFLSLIAFHYHLQVTPSLPPCPVTSLSRPGVLVAYTLLRATGGRFSGSYLGTIWDMFGVSLGVTCLYRAYMRCTIQCSRSNEMSLILPAIYASIATPDAVNSGPTPPCNIKAVPSACIEMQPTKLEGNSRIVVLSGRDNLVVIKLF